MIDFGVDQGPYLVMDFVTGTTLKDRLEQGPIPVGEAMTIARQGLAGLAHAHAQGIVHRDVKPANIMVSDEIGTGNHVRILDFGLARLRGSAATSVTQSSIVVGTPNYMAPEQTLAGEVDARTDVYAVGIVLFEMVTGQRPFSADDTAGILDAHRHQPPPHLHQVAPDLDLPPGLDRVIQRALAKDPDDRYQSAVEMANALDAVAEGRRAPQTEAGLSSVRPRGTPWSAIMFLLVLLGGGVVAYVMIGRGRTHGNAGSGSAPGSALATGSGDTGSDSAITPGVDASTAAIIPVSGADAAVAAVDLMIDAAPSAMVAITDAAIAADAAALATADVDAVRPDAYQGEIEMAAVEIPTADPTAEPAQIQPDDDEPAPPEPTPAITPTPVAPAKSIPEALAMAKRGQRTQAIEGLRILWRKSPKSGKYPYTLGNLYFDKKWWSVAMEHYTAAIKLYRGYRSNGIMIRNVIRALGDPKTRGRAWWFLKKIVGSPARPYLRAAAKSNPKPAIRSAAKALLR